MAEDYSEYVLSEEEKYNLLRRNTPYLRLDYFSNTLSFSQKKNVMRITVDGEKEYVAMFDAIQEEEKIALHPSVTAICDILGFDPLYLASEGCALIACAPEETETALERLRAHPNGRGAALIGHVTADHGGLVGMKTTLGGTRIVDMPIGEILPRIC